MGRLTAQGSHRRVGGQGGHPAAVDGTARGQDPDHLPKVWPLLEDFVRTRGCGLRNVLEVVSRRVCPQGPWNRTKSTEPGLCRPHSCPAPPGTASWGSQGRGWAHAHARTHTSQTGSALGPRRGWEDGQNLDDIVKALTALRAPGRTGKALFLIRSRGTGMGVPAEPAGAVWWEATCTEHGNSRRSAGREARKRRRPGEQTQGTQNSGVSSGAEHPGDTGRLAGRSGDRPASTGD